MSPVATDPQILIRLSPEQMKALKEMAKGYGMTKTAFARWVIEKALDD